MNRNSEFHHTVVLFNFNFKTEVDSLVAAELLRSDAQF